MESSYFVGAAVILVALSALAQVPLVNQGLAGVATGTLTVTDNAAKNLQQGGAGRRGDGDDDFTGRGELWR